MVFFWGGGRFFGLVFWFFFGGGGFGVFFWLVLDFFFVFVFLEVAAVTIFLSLWGNNVTGYSRDTEF